MRRLQPLAAALALIAGVPLAHAQSGDDPFRVHAGIYRKVAPSVVFVYDGRVNSQIGVPAGMQGSGVVIRSDGIILTALSACGQAASSAQVILPGHRRVAANVVGRVIDLDLAVLKVEVRDLPALPFGDSEHARVGQVVYALGDSFASIYSDDQVAMSVGVLSGTYELEQPRPRSSYKGPVLETSAAVNPHQNGGPLVDAQGRILGILTLNYHDAKFAGAAVPIHVLKPEIDRILRKLDGGPEVAGPEPKPAPGVADRGGWLGVDVQEAEPDGVRVVSLDPESPAREAGLKEGDVILKVGRERVLRPQRFQELVRRSAPGARLKLRVLRDEEEKSIVVPVRSRPVF